MSKTLNLIDILLTSGRNLMMMGRFTEAMEPLTRLAEFRKLPEHVLQELHTLRAEIFIQQEKYHEARRCLTAAIVLKPLEARNHYLMAIAIEEDEQADLKRAEIYFERAVQIEPENAATWVDFGSYLFKIGKEKQALRAIRKAYALETADADIVGQVAQVLRREGHGEEATAKLRAALFQNHGAARFRRLWQQHQFEMLHAQQQKKPCGAEIGDRPVLLPFEGETQPNGKYMELGEKTLRFDRAESFTGPSEQKPVPYRRPPKG